MRRLASYEVLGRIGAGSTADIFAARDDDGSPFALKCLRAALLEHPAIPALFRVEAAIQIRLAHAHVVRAYELFDDGGPVLVQELVDGPSLLAAARLLERRGVTIPPRAAAHIARAVADALAHVAAHRLGDAFAPGTAEDGDLVHRDIVPANILLSRTGDVKLTDFGVVRVPGRPSPIAADVVIGNPGYVAPEALRGEEVDPRADLFGLGVVLWEMLAGRRLYPDEPGRGDRIAAEPPPPSGIDGPLDALALRLLEKDRARRPGSAAEVREALDAVVPVDEGASLVRALVEPLGLPSLLAALRR